MVVKLCVSVASETVCWIEFFVKGEHLESSLDAEVLNADVFARKKQGQEVLRQAFSVLPIQLLQRVAVGTSRDRFLLGKIH